MRDLTAPHVRWNPLRREWILVSPQRNARPWQGQIERVPAEAVPAHDPSCYLCPRSHRAGGAINPDYRATFVFDNDFPALLPATAATEQKIGDLLIARTEPGVCRVVCFSPRHDLTLSRMDRHAVRGVVDVWVEESRSIGSDPALNYVEIFENRG